MSDSPWPDGESPQVELTWDLWCAQHLEPYRADWPQGAAVAMVELFRAAVAMPAVIDAAKADADNLTAALQRFKPLCCFVGRDALQAIYDKSLGRGPVDDDAAGVEP